MALAPGDAPAVEVAVKAASRRRRSTKAHFISGSKRFPDKIPALQRAVPGEWGQMASYLDGLNGEQRRAVETTEGPSSSSPAPVGQDPRHLPHRPPAVPPRSPKNILAVTFTNKAYGRCAEMSADSSALRSRRR
jgi:hypothetical protein